MNQRPWSAIEAEYAARMRERYGDSDAARSEEMTRKLEEIRQAWDDPFRRSRRAVEEMER